MAGYPPPYPPPPGAPFGYDPRQQARMARRQIQDQVRAQKMAFRAQRDLYRQQTRAMRRSSILGPLLLVGIGVTLLLLRLDRLPYYEFAEWYGHWWPLLFVGAGLVLAVEWAFDHHNAQSGVPLGRRGVGGGVIFLLILLALGGGAISAFHNNQTFLRGLHVDSDQLGQAFGERHEYEQLIDNPFPAGTVLSIDNPHGDVSIIGRSTDDKIHIVVNKQVYSWSEDDASSRADRLSPRVSQSGGSLFVTVPSMDSGSADLAITVPDFAQTTVNAVHGDVSLADMKAPVSVTANHGSIELNRITGPVTVHLNNNGSDFSAHNIVGDVTLRGHADDLNLTEITGKVSLEGEFYGDTHLEHLGAPFSFRTGRTQFSVGKLHGMVDISSDEEMTGSQLVGPTELRTRSRNVSFERVAGSVDIINSNGTVDLTNAAPLGNITVENTNGAITLTLPETAGATLQGDTKDGGITDDFTNTSIPSTNNASLSKTIGDGSAHVSLRTSHADVTIHKGVIEPPVPPAPPSTAPPAPPAPAVLSVPSAPPAPSHPKHKIAPSQKPDAPAPPPVTGPTT